MPNSTAVMTINNTAAPLVARVFNTVPSIVQKITTSFSTIKMIFFSKINEYTIASL